MSILEKGARTYNRVDGPVSKADLEKNKICIFKLFQSLQQVCELIMQGTRTGNHERTEK